MNHETAHAQATEEFAPRIAERAAQICEEYVTTLKEEAARKRTELEVLQSEIDGLTAQVEENSTEEPQG